MTQFQYQEQEDLTDVLDASFFQDEDKLIHRDSKSRTTVKSRKYIRKSTLKPTVFQETHISTPDKSTNYLNKSLTKVQRNKQNVVDKGQYELELDVLDGFTSESFTALQSFFSEKLETSVLALLWAFCHIGEALSEVPKYEEELKYLTSFSLICYGGSWTTLAGILAAVEVFEIELVLQEAIEVGTIFFSDDTDQEVSPIAIKESCKKLGLQISLLIAVVVSPSWAQLCISIAFASKFVRLVPIEQFLRNTMSRPDIDKNELDEYFSHVDTDWFHLLNLVVCNITSLTFFGCFPRLLTAMYMGYLGVSVLMESLVDRFSFYIPIVWESEVISKRFWMKGTTQCCVWGLIALMSVWQAFYGYGGVCLFLSWSMFLHPVVQVFNMLATDFDCYEGTGNTKE